jgi:hypothetical protein
LKDATKLFNLYPHVDGNKGPDDEAKN